MITHWVRLPLNIHREMHSLTARHRRTRSGSPRRVLATVSGSASPERPSATKSSSPSPTAFCMSSISQVNRPTPITGTFTRFLTALAYPTSEPGGIIGSSVIAVS